MMLAFSVAFAGAVISVPSAAAAAASPPNPGIPVVNQSGDVYNYLPNGTSGPACSRDYYRDSNTTKVAAAAFSKDRRPVVFVHGYNSDEKMWSSDPTIATGVKNPAGMLQNQTDNRIQNFLYDYSADSFRWADNDKIAACLGQYISEVGQSYNNAGGDGKVLVVAHSMGGLATLYAADKQFAKYPAAQYIGGIVTFDTPYLGSSWGQNAITAVPLVWKMISNQQLFPAPNTGAAKCLAPHANGEALPSPCTQPLPPPLPDSVPLTMIAGNISVERKFLGVHMYTVPINSDAIVSVKSQNGYASMFTEVPNTSNVTAKNVRTAPSPPET